MKELLSHFWHDEDGLETVEWAVVAAVVIGGAIVAFNLLGTKVSSKIDALQSSIT